MEVERAVHHLWWDYICRALWWLVLRSEGGQPALLFGDLVLLVLVGGIHGDLIPAGGDLVQLSGEGETGIKYFLHSMEEGHILQAGVLVKHVLLEERWVQVLGGDGVLQGHLHTYVAVLLCHTLVNPITISGTVGELVAGQTLLSLAEFDQLCLEVALGALEGHLGGVGRLRLQLHHLVHRSLLLPDSVVADNSVGAGGG